MRKLKEALIIKIIHLFKYFLIKNKVNTNVTNIFIRDLAFCTNLKDTKISN
jgi:hypothetical protein